MITMYLLDTNVLLYLQNHYYPSTFISVWDSLNELIEDRSIISIKEVQREITSEQHKEFWNNINEMHNYNFYEELTNGEENFFHEIRELEIYEKIILKNKSTGEKYKWSLKKEWEEGKAVADPLLICHALCNHSVIVTTESPRKQYNIPHVCEKLNLECIGVEELFKRNDLRF